MSPRTIPANYIHVAKFNVFTELSPKEVYFCEVIIRERLNVFSILEAVFYELTTRGRPVAEHILGCLDSLLATPFPTLLTWPRMDIDPAEDRPEAEVEEAIIGTEPTPLEEVRLGTSGGTSSRSS